MSSSTGSFLRASLRHLQEASGESKSGGQFDPKVFWSVNAFVFVLVLTMCLWCCFGNKDWLTNAEARRRATDEEYRQSVLERAREAESRKIDSPEERRQKLLRSFRRHKVQMVVKQDDLVLDSGSQEISTDNEVSSTSDDGSASLQNTGHLRIRGLNQLVPNCCAVCLGSYDEGDEVVWSSNPECAHAFHQECVVEWLIKMQPETPCPCCRQEFTDLETVRQEKKIKWTGDALNLGALSLR